MTHAEKRAAITAALEEFPTLSDRQIAARVGCDHKTVGKFRRQNQTPTEPTLTEDVLQSATPAQQEDISPLPPPRSPNACPVCGCLRFWQDLYPGRWHCYSCRPPWPADVFQVIHYQR